MKTDTIKLYKKMSSRELARLYHRTQDINEADKIRSAVPWFGYGEVIDFDYSLHLKYLTYVSLWAELEYWRITAKLGEHEHGVMMLSNNGKIELSTDYKEISCIYVSQLKGLETALNHHNLEYVLEQSEATIFADDYLKYYDLEYNTDYLEQYTKLTIKTMENALSEN